MEPQGNRGLNYVCTNMRNYYYPVPGHEGGKKKENQTGKRAKDHKKETKNVSRVDREQVILVDLDNFFVFLFFFPF